MIRYCALQIFTVGKTTGHLFHLWQKERDSSYSDWEDLGPLSDSSHFLTSPTLLFDEYGWWEALAVSVKLESEYCMKMVEILFQITENKLRY